VSDWRSVIARTGDRHNQLTGNNVSSGLFKAFIDTATGETQSGKFIYSGGERTIPLPMPFQSSTSWIRAIPEGATPVLAAYRSDLTGETVCLNYMIDSPKDILAAYETQLNIYRPLLPGEIEVNSRGGAQTFYSARPVLEQKAGAVRMWLSQDRVEAGFKAPTHVRYLHEHNSNKVGDEERFGVVKRPYNFLFDPLLLTPRNALSAALALSSTSFNYYDYPTPGTTTPAGVADIFSPRALATASNVSAAALSLVGKFKKRVFAKEYLKVITNPLFLLGSFNPVLIDIREGQVFDDKGLQTIASTGAFLRAKYQYFTPALDATTIEIDEVGNMSHSFSIGAFQGWNITIPTGPYKLKAFQDIGLISAANITTQSFLSTGISAVTNLTLSALTGFTEIQSTGISISSPTSSFAHTMTQGGEWKSGGNLKTTAVMNIDYLAGVNFTAKATAGKMVLFAPFIDIGAAPTEAMMLGTRTATWLKQLIAALQAAQPLGNLGAPVPLISDPAFATQLINLNLLIEPLKSTTIKVGP